MAFSSASLFGGSIVADLPSNYANVSDIRQVPDNQEVYLDTGGFTSVVVEILERVERPDAEALEYHLKDLVDDDAAGTTVSARGAAHFALMPRGTPAYTLLATSPPGEKQQGRANEPDFVVVVLTMLRLAEKKTDVLVVINVPHVGGQYDASTVDLDAGRLGGLVEDGVRIRDKILQTFEIKDWGLFVE